MESFFCTGAYGFKHDETFGEDTLKISPTLSTASTSDTGLLCGGHFDSLGSAAILNDLRYCANPAITNSNDKTKDGNNEVVCLMDDDIMSHSSMLNNNSRRPLTILQNENDDLTMRVMTPDIMEALQDSLPFSKQGESFWLQYSLVRDGASLDRLLENCHTSCETSVLALETTDGEVFGAYLAQPFQYSNPHSHSQHSPSSTSSVYQFYGSGESFLWKIPEQRTASFGSSPDADFDDNIDDDDDNSMIPKTPIDVYKFQYANYDIQLCHPNRLLIGSSIEDDSGSPPTSKKKSVKSSLSSSGRKKYYGFGLALGSDLLTGSSNACLTFGNPPLSDTHFDGSAFEIRNLEVWALTPTQSIEEAERSKMKKQRMLGSSSFFKRAFSFKRKKEKKKRDKSTSAY